MPELDPAGWPLPLDRDDCPDGPTSLYDPIDFLQVGSRLYDGPRSELDGASTAKLGRVILQTRCELSEGAPEAGYTFRSGDAAFLPEGTQVRELVGFEPAFRVGARVDGQLRIFQGPALAGAATGADVWPGFAEHVRSILVTSQQDGRTVLARLRDPALVGRLVDSIAAAPYSVPENPGAYDLFVNLRLDDGSELRTTYETKFGRLEFGLTLPAAARTELNAAIQNHQGQPRPSCVAVPGDYQGSRDAEAYVGLTEREARTRAQAADLTVRIVGRDADCSSEGVRNSRTRVNLDVREGIVRDAVRY